MAGLLATRRPRSLFAPRREAPLGLRTEMEDLLTHFWGDDEEGWFGGAISPSRAFNNRLRVGSAMAAQVGTMVVSEEIAALDLVTYLRDGVLVKADRSSMAYSMELRSPFLDHRLVELGLSLPVSYKVHGGTHKLILREILRSRLDSTAANRPKSGFGVVLPEGLPDAPTERGRWVKHCENVWHQRWT